MEFIFTQLLLQRDPKRPRSLWDEPNNSKMPNPRKTSEKSHGAWNENPSGQLQLQSFFFFSFKSVKLLWIFSGGIQFWPEHSGRIFELWQWNIHLHKSKNLHLYPVPRVVWGKSCRAVWNKQHFWIISAKITREEINSVLLGWVEKSPRLCMHLFLRMKFSIHPFFTTQNANHKAILCGRHRIAH